MREITIKNGDFQGTYTMDAETYDVLMIACEYMTNNDQSAVLAVLGLGLKTGCIVKVS